MINKVIDWVLGHLPLVIFAFIIIGQMVRAAKRVRQNHEEETPMRPDALEEDRRTREVQEQIRRRIAERRGGSEPAAEPPVMERRPAPAPETTQLPDVFDGPLGRMLQELQKRAQPQPVPAPPPMVAVARDSAELERQQQLADELKSLEDARAAAKRRAAQIAAEQEAVSQREPALLGTSRGRLMADLSDPQSLRRAFVLREVLSAPVALR